MFHRSIRHFNGCRRGGFIDYFTLEVPTARKRRQSSVGNASHTHKQVTSLFSACLFCGFHHHSLHRSLKLVDFVGQGNLVSLAWLSVLGGSHVRRLGQVQEQTDK